MSKEISDLNVEIDNLKIMFDDMLNEIIKNEIKEKVDKNIFDLINKYNINKDDIEYIFEKYYDLKSELIVLKSNRKTL